jgi:hypothetical protein
LRCVFNEASIFWDMTAPLPGILETSCPGLGPEE